MRRLLGLMELAVYVAVAAMFWLRPDWLILLSVAAFVLWLAGRLIADYRRRRHTRSLASQE